MALIIYEVVATIMNEGKCKQKLIKGFKLAIISCGEMSLNSFNYLTLIPEIVG